MSPAITTKVAYNYLDDLLANMRSALGSLAKTPLAGDAKKAYDDLETRYRVLSQKRYAPYAESSLLASEANASLSRALKLLREPPQQSDASRMSGFHYWENKSGPQAISKIPGEDASQPGWVVLPDLKFLGAGGNQPAQAAAGIKSQMGDALQIVPKGKDPRWPDFDTRVRATVEAWDQFLSLAPRVFDNWENFPSAKKLGLKSEKNYNPDFAPAAGEEASPYPLSVQVINHGGKQDWWDVGNKKNEKAYKPGIRLQFDPQDPNFYPVSVKAIRELEMPGTKTDPINHTIDLYDIDPKKLLALSLTLKNKFGYGVGDFNAAIQTLTGQAIGKVQKSVSNKEKSKPLSEKVVRNRLASNLIPSGIERKDFDVEIEKLYPGAFNPNFVKDRQKQLQKDGMYFILNRQACSLADEPGSGKCASGKDLAIINDEVISFEDAWDKYANGDRVLSDGGEFSSVSDVYVNGVSGDGIVQKLPIKAFYRERYVGKLRKITTSNGRVITTSYPHKFLSVDGWTNELIEGTVISAAKRLLKVSDDIKVDENLAFLLSWQIAEGHEDGSNVAITQSDTSVLNRLKIAFDLLGFQNSHNGEPATSTIVSRDIHRTTHLGIYSSQYRDYLLSLGYKWGVRAAEKELPSCLMRADDKVTRIVLQALFDAEGWVEKSKRLIGFVSASRKLVMQVSSLLSRFGILHSFSRKMNCATNSKNPVKREYYQINIIGDGGDVFMREIGFSYAYKREAYEAITSDRNVNKGCKPVDHILRPLVERYGIPFRHLGISNQSYLSGNSWATDSKIDEIICALESISSGETLRRYKEKTGNKWTAGTVAVYEAIDLGDVRSAIEQLHILRNNDLVYETIVKVEDVEYDGYIYDLTVDKYHNYVAEGLICHNTAQSVVGADFATVLQDREAAAQAAGQPPPPQKKILVFTPLALLNEHWRPGRNPNDGSVTPSKPAMFCGHGEDSIAHIRHLADFDKVGPQTRWVVIPYTTMSSADDNMLIAKRVADESARGMFGAVILDEIQTIKDLDKPQGEALRIAISAGGIKHRVGLSGTPADNDPSDLYKQLRVIRHPLLYDTAGVVQQTEKGFTQQFLGGAAYENKDDSMYSRMLSVFEWAKHVNKRLLVEMFASTFLRRTKADMRDDLPTKDRSHPKVIEGQAEHWDQRLAALRKSPNPQIAKNPWQALEKEMALAKVPHTVQSIKSALQHPNAKVFVVTKYPDIAAQISNAVGADHPGLSAYISGDIGTNSPERQIVPDTFKQPGGTLPNGTVPLRCVVYTMEIGAVGLNFGMATKFIANDIDWNPSMNIQAEDRIHRIDTKHPAGTALSMEYVYFAGTYDEEMFHRVRGKEALNLEINEALKQSQKHAGDPKAIDKIANRFIVSLCKSLVYELHLSQDEKAYADTRLRDLENFLNGGGHVAQPAEVMPPADLPVAAAPALASGSWYRRYKRASMVHRHLW